MSKEELKKQFTQDFEETMRQLLDRHKAIEEKVAIIAICVETLKDDGELDCSIIINGTEGLLTESAIVLLTNEDTAPIFKVASNDISEVFFDKTSLANPNNFNAN